MIKFPGELPGGGNAENQRNDEEDTEMTKAEKIYNVTRFHCKKMIQDWGYRVNPDGSAVGYNSVFNDDIGIICTRTLNDMEKILARDRKNLEISRRLGVGTEESNLLKEQTYNAVETTIRNAREMLAKR